MKILITGGSGFIGCNILKKLENSKHQVLSLSRKNRVGNKNFKWIKCDLSKKKSYQDHIKQFDPDILIHLSWDKIPNFSREICNKNLEDSINLFEYIFENTNCKKVIVSGSCFEYSKQKLKTKEKDFSKPTNHFTVAKFAVLKWLTDNEKKFKYEFIWFRIFYAFGPRQKNNSLIPYLIKTLKDNNLPDIKNPHTSLDFVHIETISKYFIKALSSKYKSGIYNIGSGKAINILTILEILEKKILKRKKSLLKNNFKNIKPSNKLQFSADMNKSKVFKVKNKSNFNNQIIKLIDEY